jgi:hypothetical protein
MKNVIGLGALLAVSAVPILVARAGSPRPHVELLPPATGRIPTNAAVLCAGWLPSPPEFTVRVNGHSVPVQVGIWHDFAGSVAAWAVRPKEGDWPAGAELAILAVAGELRANFRARTATGPDTRPPAIGSVGPPRRTTVGRSQMGTRQVTVFALVALATGAVQVGESAAIALVPCI